MNIIDIISKKRDGLILTEEEIDFFVRSAVDNTIKKYQISSLLMAIYIKGMNEDETFWLTMAMLRSGDIFDLSSISGITVDKHSTGGVGDKVSIALGPILAACGLVFAKMSGRALMHTGGTLDKLESLPNLNVFLNKEEFEKQVNDLKIAIVGQSANLVPADKILYSLRDVTATVSSLPLIASSIMSKKLAASCDIILLDVKYGDGAFMKNKEDARKLANLMIAIGKRANKNVKAILSNMNQPLGNNVGNLLELIEARDTLLHKIDNDFSKLCVESAGILLYQAKIVNSIEEGKEKALETIKNNKAYEIFEKFLNYQGASLEDIRNMEGLLNIKNIVDVKSNKKGYVHGLEAYKIGILSMELGGGRLKISDQIDHSSGIILNKKIGDYVEEDEVIAKLYSNKEINEYHINKLMDSYQIEESFYDKEDNVEELI